MQQNADKTTEYKSSRVFFFLDLLSDNKTKRSFREREKERVRGDQFTEGHPSSVYRRGWEKEGRWRRHAVVRGPPGRTRRCRIGSWSS